MPDGREPVPQVQPVPGSIMYWHWEEGDLDREVRDRQIDDICDRSAFDLIVIGPEHCSTICESDAMHEAIRSTVERFHSRGRRVMVGIDPRQEGPAWVARGLDVCLGWVDTLDTSLDADVAWTSDLPDVFDQFGRHVPAASRVLDVVAYRPGTTPGTYAEKVHIEANTEKASPGSVAVTVAPRPGWRALIFVVHQMSYPDVFGTFIEEHQRRVLEQYADTGLDGVHIDEWGATPQPNFIFDRAWARPWWSEGFASLFQAETGGDLLEALFHQQVAPDGAPEIQTAAIRDYFRCFRNAAVRFETFHHTETHRVFGSEAFVGTHPTWWGLDEQNQSYEFFRNGFDWWGVPRDFAQTDEFVPMGVRLSLARKAGRSPFYNMWYSDSTHDVGTYFAETWRNARYAGRTHYTSYRCEGGEKIEPALVNMVLQLGLTDALDQVSEMEERLRGLTPFLGPLVATNVLVVVGMDAAVDWRNHVGHGGTWTYETDTISRGYAALRALWDAGYHAEFVPDYEELAVDAEGRVVWCGNAYEAAVFIDAEVPAGALRAAAVDSASEALTFVRNQGAEPNDVPMGCRLENGAVVCAAEGVSATGNRFATAFTVGGRRVEADAEDFLAVSADLRAVAAGALHRFVVDGDESFLDDNNMQVTVG